MATVRVYLRIQLMTFVFGIVGPLFLIIYFASQPEPELKWMYWWGLFITAADILAALAMTETQMRSERAVRRARQLLSAEQ
ncbi:MAG: hypothetical protein SW019_13075 [Actinomycetota bacterium]|nr:hypothetical protein [Actinomycetota bacterium]